jgi:hypothetical protein
MTVLACRLLVEEKNQGCESQLILLNGTVTVTVTDCPYVMVLGSTWVPALLQMVTVAPVIPDFGKYPVVAFVK